MTTFDESKIRRGQPDNAGKFASKATSAPTGALAGAQEVTDEAPTAPVDVAAAATLSRYGIDPRQIDGFDESWRDHFRILDTPEPEKITDVLRDEGIEIDSDQRVSEVQDLGCGRFRYWTDYRDDDSEEEHDVELDDMGTARLREAFERDGEHLYRAGRKRARDAYVQGLEPAWGVLAEPRDLTNARSWRAGVARGAEVAAERSRHLAAHVEAWERVSTDPTPRAVNGVYGAPLNSMWTASGLKQARSTLHNEGLARDARDRLSAVMDEASALPDGALRRHLLEGDRPQLTVDLEHAESVYRRHRADAESYRDEAQRKREAFAEALDAHEKAANELEDAQRGAILAGLPEELHGEVVGPATRA